MLREIQSLGKLMLQVVLLVISMLLASPVFAEGIILAGGTVIDGTGKPGIKANVRIQEGRIAGIGNFKPQPGETVIDVSGLIVAPGFIDVHNHSAAELAREPAAVSQIAQGITTAALGPDGGGPFAVDDFLSEFAENPTSLNILTFVGHGTVRRKVLGDDYKRPATWAEMRLMELLVEQAMKEGAFGLSTGLEYDPGFYSTTEEVVALAKVTARFGGIYMSHIRDEADNVMDAIREAIEIGRQAKLPVQISHIKLGTVGVWGKTRQALALIDQARCEGVDVAADAYPYNAWSSGITVLVSSRRFDDPDAVRKGLADVGGAKNVLITRCEAHPEYNFKTLEAIATDRNTTPVGLYMEIVKEGGAGIVCQSMNDEDVYAFFRHPWIAVASDGGLGARHPRGSGTFPRVLGLLVREKKVLRLEEAIRKMTSLPAARLGLKTRGILKKGFPADIAVFDAKTIGDKSSFQEPFVLPEGMHYVFVNGVLVWDNGKPTDARPGHVMR